MAGKPKMGFSKLLNKATNNMETKEILAPSTDHLLLAVLFHAALLGALFGQGTNRARSAVKWFIMLDDDKLELWANTPEEAVMVLAEINDVLVSTAIERGLLEKAPGA